jgi:hypothetical protein
MEDQNSQIRIVHEDSIAILPNGTTKALTEPNIWKPLLVLNPEEINQDGFRKVLASGLYRRLFCDPKRVEHIKNGLKQHGKESLF